MYILYNIITLLRLSILPLLTVVAAYPPGYIGYLKDFPEARNFADFTLFQTAKGMFYKVCVPLHHHPVREISLAGLRN